MSIHWISLEHGPLLKTSHNNSQSYLQRSQDIIYKSWFPDLVYKTDTYTYWPNLQTRLQTWYPDQITKPVYWPISQRVAIEDQVRLSCGSDEERRMETRGLTSERGKSWGVRTNACLTNLTACSFSISLLACASRDLTTRRSTQCFSITRNASLEVRRYRRTRSAPALTSLTPLTNDRRALWENMSRGVYVNYSEAPLHIQSHNAT